MKFFPSKRCSCKHRVNMWTSGHMISMKNCKAMNDADKKKLCSISSNNGNGNATTTMLWIFSLICRFTGVFQFHWTGPHIVCTLTCCCFRLSHSFFSTVLQRPQQQQSALNGCDEIEKNGFVGDYNISLDNISWHISWISFIWIGDESLMLVMCTLFASVMKVHMLLTNENGGKIGHSKNEFVQWLYTEQSKKILFSLFSV